MFFQNVPWIIAGILFDSAYSDCNITFRSESVYQGRGRTTLIFLYFSSGKSLQSKKLLRSSLHKTLWFLGGSGYILPRIFLCPSVLYCIDRALVLFNNLPVCEFTTVNELWPLPSFDQIYFILSWFAHVLYLLHIFPRTQISKLFRAEIIYCSMCLHNTKIAGALSNHYNTGKL